MFAGDNVAEGLELDIGHLIATRQW